jgi:ubiquinone/menaquinone biosynthesis C-methylase UbiE
MNDSPPIGSWEQAVIWLRGQPDQQVLVHASYYDDPLNLAAERYRNSEEWSAIQKFIGAGRGRHALDLGAGRGIASYALAKDGFDVIALEPDPSTLVGAGAIRSLAKSENLPIRAVQEFSEKLPFSDATFDVVFARAVLHHTRDLGAACQEIYRVLKPGGMLLAVREHVLSCNEDLEKFLKAHPLHHLYGGEHAYISAQYQGALRTAGFCVKVLRSFDSAINYFPQTDESLRQKLTNTMRRIPLLHSLANTTLTNTIMFRATCRLLSYLDNRPGRHHSFICTKPI